MVNRRPCSRKAITHYAEAAPPRKDGSKLYWCDREGMRVMRCEPRRLARRNAGRDRPRRLRTGADADPVVRRNHHRFEIWENLLDAKGPTKGGLGRLCRANIDIPNGREPSKPL